MLPWWDALWMLSAALAWTAVRRLAPSRRHALAAAGVLSVALTIVLAVAGLSFSGSAADRLAPPVVAFVAALTLAALAVDAHPYARPWLFGALGVGSLIVWGALQVHRAFSHAPTTGAPLPNHYRYEVAMTGMAFTSDIVETRMFQTPAALPFVEWAVATSSVHGSNFGADPARLAVRVDTVAGRRVLVVRSEGHDVDRVDY
jgi:tetrahydromethanopterin S-methyltransferase subunit C